jgi:hypothetical protein
MICRTPDKKAYQYIEDAEMAARLAGGEPETSLKLRVYKCDCGNYHLTKARIKPPRSQRYF